MFIFLEFSVVKDSTLRVTMTTSRYPLWKPKATDLSSKYSVYPLLEKKKKAYWRETQMNGDGLNLYVIVSQ